jgi:hypothetical protein
MDSQVKHFNFFYYLSAEYVQKYASENATQSEEDEESDLSSYSSDDSDHEMDDDDTQFPFTK